MKKFTDQDFLNLHLDETGLSLPLESVLNGTTAVQNG